MLLEVTQPRLTAAEVTPRPAQVTGPPLAEVTLRPLEAMELPPEVTERPLEATELRVTVTVGVTSHDTS